MDWAATWPARRGRTNSRRRALSRGAVCLPSAGQATSARPSTARATGSDLATSDEARPELLPVSATAATSASVSGRTHGVWVAAEARIRCSIASRAAFSAVSPRGVPRGCRGLGRAGALCLFRQQAGEQGRVDGPGDGEDSVDSTTRASREPAPRAVSQPAPHLTALAEEVRVGVEGQGNRPGDPQGLVLLLALVSHEGAQARAADLDAERQGAIRRGAQPAAPAMSMRNAADPPGASPARICWRPTTVPWAGPLDSAQRSTSSRMASGSLPRTACTVARGTVEVPRLLTVPEMVTFWPGRAIAGRRP